MGIPGTTSLITGRRFAAITAAALTLAGCSEPYDGWALRPVGYAGAVQFWQEPGTGCFYQQNTKPPAGPIVPMLRPDGSHMGCSSAEPVAGESSRDDQNQSLSGQKLEVGS